MNSPKVKRVQSQKDLVRFPITISKHGNFRIGTYLFGIRKPVKKKQDKSLCLLDEGSAVTISGLFGDGTGRDWKRYSGDIKASGTRHYFKLLLEVKDSKYWISIENFESFWDGLGAFMDSVEQLELTESIKEASQC